MPLTDREILIRRAILKVLSECGDYLLLENLLFDAAMLKVPQLRKSEFAVALSALDVSDRVQSVHGERGDRWRITANGKADLDRQD